MIGRVENPDWVRSDINEEVLKDKSRNRSVRDVGTFLQCVVLFSLSKFTHISFRFLNIWGRSNGGAKMLVSVLIFGPSFSVHMACDGEDTSSSSQGHSSLHLVDGIQDLQIHITFVFTQTFFSVAVSTSREPASVKAVPW
jgi:hypothetical protein